MTNCRTGLSSRWLIQDSLTLVLLCRQTRQALERPLQKPLQQQNLGMPPSKVHDLYTCPRKFTFTSFIERHISIASRVDNNDVESHRSAHAACLIPEEPKRIQVSSLDKILVTHILHTRYLFRDLQDGLAVIAKIKRQANHVISIRAAATKWIKAVNFPERQYCTSRVGISCFFTELIYRI